MTELSRERIEEIRAGGDAMADTLDDLCDMALAKKDAEQRAQRANEALGREWARRQRVERELEQLFQQMQRAEAECERLRGILQSFEDAVDLWLPQSVDAEHEGEAQALHGLRNRYLPYLVTPPPEDEYRNPLTGHRDQDPAAHPTPEQTEGEPMSEHEKRRNRRINKLMGDLWDVVENDDPEQPIKSNAAWDLLDRFDREVREDAVEPQQAGDALAALNREIDTQEMNVVGRNQMGGCMPPSYRAKLRTICESDGAVYLPVEELSELLDAFDELEARHLTASGVPEDTETCPYGHCQLRFRVKGVPYVPEDTKRLLRDLQLWMQGDHYRFSDEPSERESWLTMVGRIEKALASAPADGHKEKYHELLYAVARKPPGESRHETALRYIQNAESGGNCQVAAAPTHGGSEHE